MTSKFKQSSCFLMFSALSEIMLSNYNNITKIKHYDPYLHLKLKNLKVNFEQVSKKAHLMFPEDEQIIFMKMITIFEKLIESAIEEKSFMQLMGLIESWQKGNITMINNKEELIKLACENNDDIFNVNNVEKS